MFFKKAVMAIILTGSVLLMLSGCKRKEETLDLPEPEVEEEVADVPEEFEPLPGTEPPVYISESPCTIQQYVEYRENMGYGVPDRLDKEDIDRSDPITGLAQAEAERFANWQLARIPSESEWNRAGEIVTGPYPWDGPSPRANAPLFLVRDWLQGNDGEQEARHRKEELMNTRMEELGEEIADLLEETKNEINELTKSVNREWRDVKTKLFSEVEKYKDAAEKKMLIQRGRDLYDNILSDIQAKKLRLRTMKIDDDYREEDWQENLSAYRNRLEEIRNHAQDHKTEIIETNSELSDEVRNLKENIEELAVEGIPGLKEIQENLPQKPDEFSDIEQAVGKKQKLSNLREEAQDISEGVEKQLRGFLEEIIPQLGEELDSDFDEEELEAVRKNLKDREETITRWSERIGIEFEQEEQLLKDLRDLKRFRARKEALKTELEILEQIVSQMQRQQSNQ